MSVDEDTRSDCQSVCDEGCIETFRGVRRDVEIGELQSSRGRDLRRILREIHNVVKGRPEGRIELLHREERRGGGRPSPRTDRAEDAAKRSMMNLNGTP